MFGALLNGISGLYSNIVKQRISANNVANVNTTAYKAWEAQTEVSATGGASYDVSISHKPGAFMPTNSPLDIAIEGDGFFKVMDDDGNVGYVRSGRFSTDAEGYLATSDGWRLSPPVKVGSEVTSVSVAGDGAVWGMNEQTGQIDQVGNIYISEFPNPSGMNEVGGKFFASSESGSPIWGTPGTAGLGTLRSGGLETSNVDLAEEMVNQTLSERGAEANIKTIQTANEMLGTIMDMVD